MMQNYKLKFISFKSEFFARVIYTYFFKNFNGGVCVVVFFETSYMEQQCQKSH